MSKINLPLPPFKHGTAEMQDFHDNVLEKMRIILDKDEGVYGNDHAPFTVVQELANHFRLIKKELEENGKKEAQKSIKKARRSKKGP